VLQVQDLDGSLVDESRFDDKDPKPFKFKEAQDEIWGSFDGPVLLLVIFTVGNQKSTKSVTNIQW
jgi:hypothetical protein